MKHRDHPHGYALLTDVEDPESPDGKLRVVLWFRRDLRAVCVVDTWGEMLIRLERAKQPRTKRARQRLLARQQREAERTFFATLTRAQRHRVRSKALGVCSALRAAAKRAAKRKPTPEPPGQYRFISPRFVPPPDVPKVTVTLKVTL